MVAFGEAKVLPVVVPLLVDVANVEDGVVAAAPEKAQIGLLEEPHPATVQRYEVPDSAESNLLALLDPLDALPVVVLERGLSVDLALDLVALRLVDGRCRPHVRSPQQ